MNSSANNFAPNCKVCWKIKKTQLFFFGVLTWLSLFAHLCGLHDVCWRLCAALMCCFVVWAARSLLWAACWTSTCRSLADRLPLICQSVRPFVRMPARLTACLSAYLPVFPLAWVSGCLSVCMSAWLSVWLSLEDYWCVCVHILSCDTRCSCSTVLWTKVVAL